MTGPRRRLAASALPVLAVLALAGCADPDAAGSSAGAGPGLAPDLTGQRYQVVGTVLESPQHGPQLCRAVAESYPPQCSGPDLVGWDWSMVEAESAAGTTWGSYLLVGTWDGERFTLTGPARPDDGSLRPEPVDLTTPCPEPAGGWAPVDRERTTEAGLQAAVDRASSAPDYAGAWVHQVDDLATNDPTQLILNLRFTGDLAAHEQRIREVWGGALCVTSATRTEAELLDILDAVTGLPGVQSAGIDVTTNVVTVQVLVASDELTRELADRYGDAVAVEGWLHPVG